jgi:hypothetical protein
MKGVTMAKKKKKPAKKKAAKKKVVKKKAAKKKPAKKKPAKKKARSKKGQKAKRYTEAKKKQILAFIAQINKKKGKGGVAAAVRRYRVSPITINRWIKKKKKK